MLLGEPLDGAGNLISGSVGDMRQLRELPRISALRFGFPTDASDAPLARFAAAPRFRSEIGRTDHVCHLMNVIRHENTKTRKHETKP